MKKGEGKAEIPITTKIYRKKTRRETFKHMQIKAEREWNIEIFFLKEHKRYVQHSRKSIASM